MRSPGWRGRSWSASGATLQGLDDRRHEAPSLGAVDDAVVVGEAQGELPDDRHGVVPDDRARLGAPHRENGGGSVRDDRGSLAPADRSDVGHGEGLAAQLVDLQCPVLRSRGQPADLPGQLVDRERSGVADNGDHQPVGGVDREADVVEAAFDDVIALHDRVEGGEADQDRNQAGDQERLDRRLAETGPLGEKPVRVGVPVGGHMGYLPPGPGEALRDGPAEAGHGFPHGGTGAGGGPHVRFGYASQWTGPRNPGEVHPQLVGQFPHERQGERSAGCVRAGFREDTDHGRRPILLRWFPGRRRGCFGLLLPSLAGFADDRQQRLDLDRVAVLAPAMQEHACER